MSDSYGGDAPRNPSDDRRRADSYGEPSAKPYVSPYDDPFGHLPPDDSLDDNFGDPARATGAASPRAGDPVGNSRPAPAPQAPADYRPPYAPPPAQGSAAGRAQGGARPRRNRAPRSRFWAGFVLSFTLLSLATCGGMVVALGLDELRISDFAGNDAAWTPPTLMPTPEIPAEAVAAAATGAAPAVGRFAPGQTARNVTNSRVNLRRTPGHLGKGGDDVIVQVPAGDSIVIQGETAGADNLTWWLVSYQGIEGWMAESTASGVQILGE